MGAQFRAAVQTSWPRAVKQLEPTEAAESRQEQMGPRQGRKTGRAAHQAQFPFPLPLISGGDVSQQATKKCLETATLRPTSDPHVLLPAACCER